MKYARIDTRYMIEVFYKIKSSTSPHTFTQIFQNSKRVSLRKIKPRDFSIQRIREKCIPAFISQRENKSVKMRSIEIVLEFRE